jgi:small subunit ribosomal protein S27Ae
MAEKEAAPVVKAKPKAEKQGKKPHKNKPTSKKYEHYSNGKKKDKTCPRCGPATFLANHKTRLSCGKCKYTEFSVK